MLEDKCNAGFPDEYVRPFTEDLVSVPANSLLYRVVARDQPLELGGVDRHIADLVLVGGLTTSMWGDQHLFFRHQAASTLTFTTNQPKSLVLPHLSPVS